MWEAVLVVAVLGAYLVALRLADFNEREPLPLLAGVFGLAVAVGVLWVAASAIIPFLLGSPLLTVFATELLRLAVVGLGFVAVGWYSRRHRWDELNGFADAAIYGAAAGLGFGAPVIASSAIPGVSDAFAQNGPQPLTILLPIMVAGLYELARGALMGMAIKAASARVDARLRFVWAFNFVGLAVLLAIGLPTLLGNLANIVPPELVIWTWALVPVAAIVTVVVANSRRERLILREELADEVETGQLTEPEMRALLDRGKGFSGLGLSNQRRWKAFLARHELKHLSVQLALVKRESRLSDAEHPINEAVGHLRQAIAAAFVRAGARPRARERGSGTTIASLLLIGSVLTSSIAVPQGVAAEHQSRVTVNGTTWAGPQRLARLRDEFYTIANLAQTGCRSGAALNTSSAALAFAWKWGAKKTSLGTAAAIIWQGATFAAGVNFCDMTVQAANAAQWAAYHSASYHTVQFQGFLYQEDRHFITDRCHSYFRFGVRWVIWDMITAGGCPTSNP